MLDFFTNHGIEVLGTIVGLVYLYYEYHANKAVWIASVIMPCISMYIYYTKGLYADFSINIYYLAIAVYGYVKWTRKRAHTRPERAGHSAWEKPGEKTGESASEKAGETPVAKAELPVTHVPGVVYLGIVAVTGALWFVLWYWLSHYTDSTVPVADAFTTALSIVAMWMMARKYAEQWLAWLIVDAICVGLYIYKGLVFYPVLYGVYTIVAVFGYRKWLKLITKY